MVLWKMIDDPGGGRTYPGGMHVQTREKAEKHCGMTKLLLNVHVKNE